MDELAMVFQKVLYFVSIDENGLLTIHAQGRPAEIPKDAYAEAILHPQIDFACERCGQAVKSAMPAGSHVQLCRCLMVQHRRPDRGYTSSSEWTAFHETYERESLALAPNNPTIFDPISKKPIGVTKKGKDFLTRKLGFKKPIEVSQDGALIKTVDGGSIFTDPKTRTCSVDLQSDEEAEDLMRAFTLKTGGGPPPNIILIGNEDDYVFPPEAHDIGPRPFKCPHCGVRVKGGTLDYLAVDRIYTCFCMSVDYRRDVPSARSSGEWKAHRDLHLKSRVRHRAANANGNS